MKRLTTVMLILILLAGVQAIAQDTQSTPPTLAPSYVDFSTPQINKHGIINSFDFTGMIFRPDYNTWSFFNDGGTLTVTFTLPETMPIKLSLKLCAALVDEKANCPIDIQIDGESVVSERFDTNPHFHYVNYDIDAKHLHGGENTLKIDLAMDATTQMFIKRLIIQNQ